MLAHRLRRLGRHASSIGFGPLRGGLMPAAMVDRLAKTGVASWDMPKAAAVVLEAAASARSHTMAVELDWSLFGRKRTTARAASAAAATPQGALFDRIRVVDPSERAHVMTEAVLAEAAGVLGMNPAEWGDVRRGFFDMGMDSLTAMELRKRLEVLLGRSLPVTMVFDNANVDALQRALTKLIFSESSEAVPTRVAEPAPSRALPEDSLAATLERLERLVADR
jgi:hypothetical protein